jgi:hypothetical protein
VPLALNCAERLQEVLAKGGKQDAAALEREEHAEAGDKSADVLESLRMMMLAFPSI